ncbi:prion-inhibition and propagation domain-containing protein [Trichoderma ceciliae]
MALEIISWSVGMGGISPAFQRAIKTVNLIQSSLDPRETDPEFLVMRYRIVLTRLEQWGAFCGIGGHSAVAQPSTLSHKPKTVQNLIVDILRQIESLKDDANVIVKKHNISLPATAPVEKREEGPQDKPNPKPFVKKEYVKKVKTFKLKFTWVNKDRDRLEAILLELGDLVTQLEAFVPECNLPFGAFIASLLAKSNSKEQLEALAQSDDKIHKALASAAQAKAIMDASPSGEAGNASLIATRSLTFAKDASKFGILQTEKNMPLSVWVEWNLVRSSARSGECVKRINSLAYLLERVSKPEICLPPCLGVYEDVAYERQHREKRIGLVFGVPNQDHRESEYDGNLQGCPPKTLASLMQDEKNAPIPLLGDRFQLASELATAFSCFHAAGWLHKGINAESILFFHQVNNQGITITKPFITGFQFSRPQDGASLSQGPLENGEFDQYYHPSANNGFTKPRDLYGLGVVLCEIGQWRLMADRVSKQKKASLKDRSAWRDFMVDNVLVDVGWRMGKYYQSAVRALLLGELPEDGGDEVFAQQYLEKVIRPLSRCVA